MLSCCYNLMPFQKFVHSNVRDCVYHVLGNVTKAETCVTCATAEHRPRQYTEL